MHLSTNDHIKKYLQRKNIFIYIFLIILSERMDLRFAFKITTSLLITY